MDDKVLDISPAELKAIAEVTELFESLFPEDKPHLTMPDDIAIGLGAYVLRQNTTAALGIALETAYRLGKRDARAE